jgi:hypothetical protein
MATISVAAPFAERKAALRRLAALVDGIVNPSREYRGDTQAENEPLSSGGSRQLAVPSKELACDKVVVG